MTLATTTIELPPRLMVGARSIADLEAAIRGGADMIDVGFAGENDGAGPNIVSGDTTSISALRELIDYASFRAPGVGICLSLGELKDLEPQRLRLELPSQVRWVRLGLAGSQHRSDWRKRWQDARSALEAANSRPIRCLAVAYIDADSDSPPLPEVQEAAIKTRCAGLLLDTFSKSALSLGDSLHPLALTQLARSAREQRLPLLFAGGIKADDLDWLCPLEPAAIGVRRAVCSAPEGELAVCESLVAAFKESLERAADFHCLPLGSQQRSRAAVTA